MSDQLRELQEQIVAAVQKQLTQYSEQVAAEVQRLRDDIATEGVARTQLDEQLRALATGVERSQTANSTHQTDLQRTLDERLTEYGTATKRRHDEIGQRLDSIVSEVNNGLGAAVESATRPILRDVESRQERVETDLSKLDKNLRKFDDQAAKMVGHINEVTASSQSRLDQMSAGISADIETRVGGVAARLDEVAAQAARHQSEVSNLVGQRVEDAESRINDKVGTVEARINEETGARIADIDAYVGRISVGLDEGIVTLNDRIAEVHGRFEQVGQQIAEVQKSVEAVDVEEIDELKEKVSSAAGEAMLVRIEMERFQESMGDTMDKTSVRLTEVETQLQDQAMDTETAVQLERLEEVERALIALDPTQFVRVDDQSRNGAASFQEATTQNDQPAPVDQPQQSAAEETVAEETVAELTTDFEIDLTMAPPTTPLTSPDNQNPNDALATSSPTTNA